MWKLLFLFEISGNWGPELLGSLCLISLFTLVDSHMRFVPFSTTASPRFPLYALGCLRSQWELTDRADLWNSSQICRLWKLITREEKTRCLHFYSGIIPFFFFLTEWGNWDPGRQAYSGRFTHQTDRRISRANWILSPVYPHPNLIP